MSKVIDVNERTLEQERRDLKKTSRIVRIETVCFAAAILCALVAGAVKYAEGSTVKFCTWLSYLSLPFDAAAILVVVNFVTALFREIERGDTPFRYPIADKMKGLASAVIAAGLVIGLPQTVVQAVDLFAVGSSHGMGGSVILLGGLFLGCVLMAVSYVFALGCKLQQESDETL